MEADLAMRRWNNLVIISGDILKKPVGHLRGDQFFSEKFEWLQKREMPGSNTNEFGRSFVLLPTCLCHQ